MLLLRKLFLFLFAISLVLTSCEPKEEETDPKPNTGVLTANAGADQTVQTGQTVTLDGTASKDSKNQTISYSWAFIKKPVNSGATLTGTTTANPAFVPDLVGEYELELSVTSAAGNQKDKVLITASFAALVLEDIEVKTVLEDRSTDPDAPDYLVNEDIAINAELTIKPGVIVAFAEDKRLEINDGGGAIIAKGEANKKIRFTGKMAQKGYWGGIMVWSNSSMNEFSQVEILYAGSGIPGENKTGIIVYDHARISVKNTLISQSGGYGMLLREGATLVGFAANTFSHNTEAPLRLTADNVTKLDEATIYNSNNGRNVVEIERSTIAGNGEVVWPAFNDNTSYRFVGFVNATTGWKLKPGTTIEVMEDSYIEIGSGYINAVGTPEKKITFTGVARTTGSWNGIIIYPRSSSNVMEHVQISYAGGEELLSGVKSSIAVTSGGSLSIKKSIINNSGGYGIYVNGSDVTINADVKTTNTFTANAQEPVLYR